LSIELVTADSQALVASEDENPELLWALCGGGGNFGVATALTFRLHPIGDVIAGRLSYRFTDARLVLTTFREFMASAPDELQAVVLFRREEGEPRIHVTVCWSGDPARDEFLRPLRTVARVVADNIERRPYTRTFGMTGGVPHPFSFVKGTYVQRMSDESINAIVERYALAPGPEPALGLDHYMHGAVCRLGRDAAAFDFRAPDAVHAWISAAWDDPSEEVAATGWVDETWKVLQTYSGGRVYANFPGSSAEQAPSAAYGENYPRLVAIKKQYDPSNLFRGNQNIQPADA
jgi:FAD/FMN-containing dehydrogenase